MTSPQAKRGYSHDKRGDCKQVVIGLVLDCDGFPKAHEIFDGNMQDRRSLNTMLDALEKRTGKKPGADVRVVARTGQTTADMANGPVQRVSPFPETVALLEKLGSKNNHKCVTC